MGQSSQQKFLSTEQQLLGFHSREDPEAIDHFLQNPLGTSYHVPSSIHPPTSQPDAVASRRFLFVFICLRSSKHASERLFLGVAAAPRGQRLKQQSRTDKGMIMYVKDEKKYPVGARASFVVSRCSSENYSAGQAVQSRLFSNLYDATAVPVILLFLPLFFLPLFLGY